MKPELKLYDYVRIVRSGDPNLNDCYGRLVHIDYGSSAMYQVAVDVGESVNGKKPEAKLVWAFELDLVCPFPDGDVCRVEAPSGDWSL